MNKFFIFAVVALGVTSCLPSVSTAPPTTVPVSTEILIVTETLIQTETPAPTDIPAPTPLPTLEPTAIPTTIKLPQQWNGTYTYSGSVTYRSGMVQHLTFLIEKMDESTFTGKMIWQSFLRYRGSMLKMNGEYVTDFGDEVEQVKWSNLEDYNNGDRGGTWLKWTETEIIDGAGNYTVNGWYYAHIRDDGRTMVAVYFFNATETVADSGKFFFQLVVP